MNKYEKAELIELKHKAYFDYTDTIQQPYEIYREKCRPAQLVLDDKKDKIYAEFHTALNKAQAEFDEATILFKQEYDPIEKAANIKRLAIYKQVKESLKGKGK